MAGFVPHTDVDFAQMCAFLGISSTEELYSAIPEAVRLHSGLELDPGVAEFDLLDRLESIAARNFDVRGRVVCFAGGGVYDHEVPAVTRSLAGRSEFVTAYTPYQPEVAQGVLQALFEYQSLIARLAGLPIANASLYDGAASLVEAVNLAVATSGCQRVLASRFVHPHWLEVLRTYAAGTGHEIEMLGEVDGTTEFSRGDVKEAGAIVVSYPNYLGVLEELSEARRLADETGALLVVCQDPIAAGLLRSPGELGADIVVGEGQPLGIALGFGGPYLGLFSCRSELVRRLPGRLVGETVDLSGKTAYVTTLRAREQDIRREKASSTVCTNQTLMAVTTAIQLGWLGTCGLREVALRCAQATAYLKDALLQIEGVELASSAPVLREFALRLPIDAEQCIDRLLEEGFLAGIALRRGFEDTPYEGCLLVAGTERRTRGEIDAFAAAFEKAARR